MDALPGFLWATGKGDGEGDEGEWVWGLLAGVEWFGRVE